MRTKSPSGYKVTEALCYASYYLGTFKTNERQFIRFQDISSTITFLQITPYSLWMVRMENINLQRFPMLKSFVMASYNCYYVNSFVCLNHQHIISISIGEECFHSTERNDNITPAGYDSSCPFLQISCNPFLESIAVGGNSFTSTSIVTIRGGFGWM